MTRLLKPLFHNTSTLLIPNAVTPPHSVTSHSCSPAPPLLTQHTPVDHSDDQNPSSILVPGPDSPQLSFTKVLQGEFDPLQCSPSRIITSHNPPVPHQASAAPPVSHCSAPPSLNSSPHEHTIMPHPYSSSSIPSISSSISPLLVDLAGSGSEPQTQPQSRIPLLSQSESQLRFQPEFQFISRSHPHSLSQPQLHPILQPSSMATRSREPLLNLQELEWGEQTTQLSFINEGQPSV